MKKKEYMAFVVELSEYDVSFMSWLDVLPTGHKLTNPVPIISFPKENREKIKKAIEGRGKLMPSTIHAREGYDLKRGYDHAALVAVK